MTAPAPGSDAEVVVASRRPIDPERVSALLTAPLRWRVEQVAVTGSTNADLAAAAASTESGRVRTAEEQRTGRGRSGREWFCPAGAGLMFSTLLRLPRVPQERRGWTGALLGVAVAAALEHALGDAAPAQVRLKWPNDVLVDGNKCAGILGEVVDDAIVVGAGINVSLSMDELPRADATSLLLAGAPLLHLRGVSADSADRAISGDPGSGDPESGDAESGDPESGDAESGDAELGDGDRADSGGLAAPAQGAFQPAGSAERAITPAGSIAPALPAWLDRPVLLARTLETFGDLLDRWVAADGDVDSSGLREEYLRRCSTVGTTVRLSLPGGAQLTALAVDVAPDGALVVRDDAGRRTAYSAADVVHLRPAVAGT